MKVKPKVMSRAPATALCRPSSMSHAPHPQASRCASLPKGESRSSTQLLLLPLK